MVGPALLQGFFVLSEFEQALHVLKLCFLFAVYGLHLLQVIGYFLNDIG
ncbi:hypothetical protein SAMN05444008_10579 [Cnuella takakiae]|uniref:Uncharacterized protein n=1 Tax=Cnuella takakiae TaxID=1302690 RepID=A0A1M4Z3V8_9BACT|nr:hypothetical protein SAMN05444008_10579 [Cnuella takakiae]